MPRGRSYARRTKRLTTWFFADFASNTLTAAGGTLVSSLNAAALALRPFTIIRSRFSFYLSSDQSASIEAQAVGFGIAVVSDQASAIGVTAVPTPVTDLGSDLFLAIKLMYADASSVTDLSKPGQYFEMDSRAMRKVDGDQDVVLVAEGSFTVAQGSILKSAGRMLIKTN